MRYFYSAIQKWIEFSYRKKKGVKIYMFHIVEENIQCVDDKTIAITKSGFEDFIESLILKGCTFLSLNQLNDLKDDQIHDKQVVLTFDDIFECVINEGFPYLDRKGIPYAVFVCQNYVGGKYFLKESQLKELIGNPLCTVCFHTKNHCLMRGLPTYKMMEEIDCQEFNEKFGIQIKFFAFPYGSIYAVTRGSKKIACEKYQLVFSTICSEWSVEFKKKHGNYIPRINVNEFNYKNFLAKIR